jgi:hypothetical protein
MLAGSRVLETIAFYQEVIRLGGLSGERQRVLCLDRKRTRSMSARLLSSRSPSMKSRPALVTPVDWRSALRGSSVTDPTSDPRTPTRSTLYARSSIDTRATKASSNGGPMGAFGRGALCKFRSACPDRHGRARPAPPTSHAADRSLSHGRPAVFRCSSRDLQRARP